MDWIFPETRDWAGVSLERTNIPRMERQNSCAYKRRDHERPEARQGFEEQCGSEQSNCMLKRFCGSVHPVWKSSSRWILHSCAGLKRRFGGQEEANEVVDKQSRKWLFSHSLCRANFDVCTVPNRHFFLLSRGRFLDCDLRCRAMISEEYSAGRKQAASRLSNTLGYCCNIWA
jgi:hypothetical protein